jgi:hypothetical protein
MKTITIFSTALIFTLTIQFSYAQDKKEMKELEKNYAAFTGHPKFFKKTNWALCKFSVVYKLSSSMTASAMDKNDYGAGKVKSKASSGAYAVLNGLSESDLQNITDDLGARFVKRMKEEAGVNVKSWSEFSSNDHTDKLKESAEEQELYSKSQGLAYAMTYDGAPHYNRVIVLVPGGKKLAKSMDAAVSEVTIIVDFAEMLAKAEAKVKYQGSMGNYVTYKITESTEQEMSPGVRITPKVGSQATWEAATDIQGTSVKAHDELGYMFSVGLTQDVVSKVNFVESAEVSDGVLPEVLMNRRNNKIEATTTWEITTSPDKYKAAVLDAFDTYMNDVLKIYKYHKD